MGGGMLKLEPLQADRILVALPLSMPRLSSRVHSIAWPGSFHPTDCSPDG